jgi:hypothetical protein
MRGAIRQSLRILRLPLLTTSETAAARAFTRFLRERAILYSESLTWTRLRLQVWSDNGEPDGDLRGAVQYILAAIDSENGNSLGQRYFTLHKRLTVAFSFAHTEAIAFLSHLKVAEELARNHSFSAARITRVLSELDTRVRFSRQSVGIALRSLDLEPGVSIGQTRSLFERDRDEEPSMFADADLVTGALLVQSAATDLGFSGDIGSELLRIASAPNDGTAIPYLQMLHFQSMLLEFYDHSMLDLYEFKPRGTKGNWLFSQYPAVLAPSGNPYLNNAKAVGTMDRTWANSRDDADRPGAIALYNILFGIDTMNYAARRELARSIRAWIFLFLRLSDNIATQLPQALMLVDVVRLLGCVGSGNTATLGIIEQRLLDALSRCLHPGLPSRGLGDSINTTNVSTRKLGDCDYQDSASLQVFAYEAHGGVLTNTYIEEHLRTLGKIVPLRRAELESVSNIENWHASVTFVAHQFVGTQPAPVNIDGLTVSIAVTTFSEWVATNLQINEALVGPVNELFLPPLRERRTPDFVRQKLVSLLDTTGV